MSVPADRRFVQIDVDLLGLQIFFDAPGAEFAAEAGLLVASPRRLDVGWLHVIHPDDAGAQCFHRAHRFENVARPNRSREAVRRIVGDFERVFFVVKGNDSGDGAEDFFPRDASGVRHVVENRGLHIVALRKVLGAAAAGGQLGFFFSERYIFVDAIVLFFADQRAHLGFALERRTELDLFRFLRHGVDEVFVNRFLHQDAAAGGADFALINEDAEERAIDGGFEVGIGEEDVWWLAGEVEGDALYGVGSLLDDDLADRGAAGESDFVDVGMLYQRCARGFTETRDDVHHARRQSAIGEILRELKRGERSLFGGLENAGAPGGQRRSKFPRGHEQGIIPGNDLSGDADRFFQGERHGVVRDGIDVADDFSGEAAIIFEASGGIVNVELSFDDGLT